MVFSTTDRANGYVVKEITIYPFDSNIEAGIGGVEISNLINKLSIVESIYSLGLTLNIALIDGINLLEKLKLSGNERINVKIEKFDKDTQKNTTFDLVFVVTMYPLYLKSKNKKIQGFTIEAVTEHIFMDNLLRVSQCLNGSPSKMISELLTGYLNYNEDRIITNDNVNNLYDYIVPNIKPTQAIRNILKSSADSNLAPILAWETLQSFNIAGYSEIITQEPYKSRTYKVNYMIDSVNFTPDEQYTRDITNVLETSSKLQMSKLNEAIGGGYASLTKTYDYMNKVYSEVRFDYIDVDKDFSRLSKFTSLSDQFLIDGKPLNKYASSHEINHIINTEMSSNTVLNGRGNIHHKIKQAYLNQIEHVKHSIKLYGDLELSSGKIINLSMSSGNFENKLIDEYFSGKYLVSTIVHNFAEEYTMDLTLLKDGVESSLNS